MFKVVAMKSAQIAWTDGVLNNYLGKRIDIDPCPIIVMFAKDQAAKEYNDEKFVPMVEATPRLALKVPVHLRRDRANRTEFKSFPGGFLKFVGSNSPSSVKSTPAPVVCVEEPDDCNENVREQGDTITLLEERTKTYVRRKVVFGGTPTIEGISRIEQAYKLSDQRKFFVPCHHCGETHVLDWANVKWLENDETSHEVFGKSRPETASYACPHCGGIWNDAEKNRNVRKGQWRATTAFYGTAGFYINELYSPFPGSLLAKLVEKYLVAKHALEQGDDTKMRAFVNNTQGLSYAYQTDLPDIEALRARAENYAELSIPWGGIVVTAGVDVQHDRIAVIIKAWGRGEESWLLYWGELHGQTMVAEQGAWVELDALLSRAIPHESGAQLRIRAVSVDSSDGQTADAVYSFVRRRMNRGFMAVKGSSNDDGREIFTPPKVAVDTNRHQKAHKYGLRPFIVGTQRAKDLILGHDAGAGRLKLTGGGPGRMHWYDSVRPDWYEQMTSEVKAPHRTIRNRKVWQKKAGVRNEALDCDVYALHAARSMKINLWKEDRWVAEEQRIRQPDIFSDPAPDQAVEPKNIAVQTSTTKPAKSGLFNSPKNGGFSSTRW
ncbi:phage terminase large subunit (GpA) [mine drainage metagenome]|uniref:Phage terminase large subunit (GpA) n=1 Tax=mine drainage metagenome TaxID=410659 RepID=A0A1J5T405_9ZZZZ